MVERNLIRAERLRTTLKQEVQTAGEKRLRTLVSRVNRVYKTTEDEETRYRVVLGIVDSHFSACLPLLRKALFADKSALIRHEAAFGLAEMEGIGAQPLLIKALNDPHGIVRHEAAEMLGWYGNEESIEPLKPLLEDVDTGWGVAETAKVAIDMIKLKLPNPK